MLTFSITKAFRIKVRHIDFVLTIGIFRYILNNTIRLLFLFNDR